jgi:hypothetical protein
MDDPPKPILYIQTSKADKYVFLSLSFMIVLAFVMMNLFMNTINDMQYEVSLMRYQIQIFNDKADRMEMYNLSIKTAANINGIYFTPDYYCVWTKDRNQTEIEETKCHEECHNFAYTQYEHFCKGDYLQSVIIDDNSTK